ALEEAGSRPGDRRQRHQGLPPPMLGVRLPRRRFRGKHRRSEAEGRECEMTHNPVRPRTRTRASQTRACPGRAPDRGGHMDVPTSRRRLRLGAVAGAILVTAALAAPAAAQASGFRQVNLVSDKPGLAMLTDSHLVNPWG